MKAISQHQLLHDTNGQILQNRPTWHNVVCETILTAWPREWKNTTLQPPSSIAAENTTTVQIHKSVPTNSV